MMAGSLHSSEPRTARTTARAWDTKGTSESAAVIRLVRDVLQKEAIGGVLLDVGCGTGRLYSELRGCYSQYVGVDVVRYPGFPEASDVEFYQIDLDATTFDDRRALADVVCSIETIEHVENPRALTRSIDALTRPGGRIIISTPNQLSLLSKLCLLTRNEFVHFQERPGLYPAHLTALLECDLRRLSHEAGWVDTTILFSADGRMPGTARPWPRWLCSRSGWRGRAFSDNIVLTARKP